MNLNKMYRNILFIQCKATCLSVNKVASAPTINWRRLRGIQTVVVNARNHTNVGLARTSSQLVKQRVKKKTSSHISNKVSAFVMAKQFDIDGLVSAIQQCGDYQLSPFNSELRDCDNVVHLTPGKMCKSDPMDLFIFREGSLVLWNFDETETMEALNYFKQFHIDSFSEQIVKSENEVMPFIRSAENARTGIKGGKIILCISENEVLEKFAISNAMALSVHLGAYESLLEDYIDTMLPVTEDLKRGVHIKMTKKEVLRKMGNLFALRHVINLSSDLLDTPDFYWDRENLENLYQQTFNYFSITKRTRVMNEKINHCIELVELLSSKLSDEHHIRLEWMIIALIMVEVAFEIFHYVIQYSEAEH